MRQNVRHVYINIFTSMTISMRDLQLAQIRTKHRKIV